MPLSPGVATVRGYHEHHTAWFLRLEPEVPVARRELPAGSEVRPSRPADAAAPSTVIDEAFAEWDDAPPRSLADWQARSLRRPGVDPASSRVATHRGVVVAVCVVHAGADETWVAQPATHRDHRRRGLAQQLLAEADAAGRERGRPWGGLSTDDRTGAVNRYLRLGRRVRHTVRNWSLPPGPAAAVHGPAGLVPPGLDR